MSPFGIGVSNRSAHVYLSSFPFPKSLNLVECREFRDLLLLLRSDLTESMIPHRTKLRELIIEAWRTYFQVLKLELAVCLCSCFKMLILHSECLIQAAIGQISFTMDIWSDQNRQPYLAITAHWIAKITGTNSLQLKVALIVFHRLRGNHDGETLAEAVLDLLDRAGVTVKVRLLRFLTDCLNDMFPDWPFYNG
jgi:hypothetical protein